MTLLLLSVLTVSASAQSRGSYFFENSLLRSKLNPAFAPKTDYAAIPVLGSFSFDAASNVGLKNFIFPQGETSYLFLNDNVPSETFLSELPGRDPYLQERVETDLFGYGMKIGRDGYATLSLSLVEDGFGMLSGDLLRFVKTGTGGTGRVSFAGGKGQFAGYTALSAGYSHDLSAFVEGLRAGVRVKLLVGLAAGHFAVDQIDVQYGDALVAAGLRGSGNLSGVGYSTSDGLSVIRPSLGSVGAAVDLGASWWMPLEGPEPLDGIEFSASVCDLGALRFNHGLSSLSLDHQFSFAGISDFTGDIKAQFEEVFGDLKSLAQIESGEGQPFQYKLPASVHIGATARLLQEKANVGLLYYHAVGHDNVMVACGYSPFECLNLGLNWTFLGPAGRVGFYAEFLPKKYVGLFCGMERASWRHNSSQIPIRNFTDSFAFGLNILFGE